MLTPAQKHFQQVMARRAGLETGEETLVERTAHEQILHRLRLAQSRLKGIQSKAAKAVAKKNCYLNLRAGSRGRWTATTDARMR